MHAGYIGYEDENSLRTIIKKDDEYHVEYSKKHMEKMCELSKETQRFFILQIDGALENVFIGFEDGGVDKEVSTMKEADHKEVVLKDIIVVEVKMEDSEKEDNSQFVVMQQGSRHLKA